MPRMPSRQHFLFWPAGPHRLGHATGLAPDCPASPIKRCLKARATRAKRRTREHVAPDAPEPAAIIPRRDELIDVLDDELSRLPDKYRTPIVPCQLEGRTHGEAAARLGWPIGTVSVRL